MVMDLGIILNIGDTIRVLHQDQEVNFIAINEDVELVQQYLFINIIKEKGVDINEEPRTKVPCSSTKTYNHLI